LLLAFYPILPKVVEWHTKLYLRLAKAMTGDIKGVDDAVRVMFGKRGLAVYEEFKREHRDLITPNRILRTLVDDNNFQEGLKLASEMFFDRRQRSYQHADKFRAAVILALPQILSQYGGINDVSFRSRFVGLVANQAIIDQGITSQMAFVETATILLMQQAKDKNRKREEKLRALFSSIEAKIKAELAGKASAFSAPIVVDKRKADEGVLLSSEDEHNLKEVLLLLSLSPAPEVADKARVAIKIIENNLEKTG